MSASQAGLVLRTRLTPRTLLRPRTHYQKITAHAWRGYASSSATGAGSLGAPPARKPDNNTSSGKTRPHPLQHGSNQINRPHTPLKPLPYKDLPISPALRSSRPPGYPHSPSSTMTRERWIHLSGLAAMATVVGLFTASLVYRFLTTEPEHYEAGCEPSVPTGRPSQSKTAQSPLEFDEHLDTSEYRIGVTKLRRELAAEARGHVLEVAMGTGRNLEFFAWEGVAKGPAALAVAAEASNGGKEKKEKKKDGASGAMLTYTGVDISPEMLDIGLRRVRQFVGSYMTTESSPPSSRQKGDDQENKEAYSQHLDTNLLPKRPFFNELAQPLPTASIAAPDNDDSNSGDGIITSDVPCISLLSDRLRILTLDAQTHLPLPSSSSSSSSTSNLAPDTSAPPPSSLKYDTILQTFGLCSVRDPIALLTNMSHALQPETGRIILVEHGRASSTTTSHLSSLRSSIDGLVNGILDRTALGHFERFGCWWNRDLEAVVRKAVQTSEIGLEVVRLERRGWFTFGTHVLMELRVRGGQEGGK